MRDWAAQEAAKLVCDGCRNGTKLHETPPDGCPDDWGPTHEGLSGDCWPCRGEDEGLVSGLQIAELLREAQKR